MRIGIDARYLSHGLSGGVHTYVAHFIPALLALTAEHQLFLYADTKRPIELSSLPAQATIRYLPWTNRLSSVYWDFFIWRSMSHDGLDVAHFPANYGFGPASARTVITLHDEINIMPWLEILRGHRRDLRTATMMSYLHWCSILAVRRAKVIITVSEYARRQIARYGGLDPASIVPVYHGLAPDMTRLTNTAVLEEVNQRLGVRKKFVLADALKNPAVLIRAWRRLPDAVRSEYEIVFFSRRPDPLPVVHEAVGEHVARLLINPSRSDLVALYSQAEAFVFPSWIEGFGLPVLEAMACGAPVIASDRGSIPEVAGGAALIADAEDDETLAARLLQVLTSEPEKFRLRSLGARRAANFTWQKSAQGILDCYRMAVTTG
jgi:glycosyltransferase involved in cell wall biosynthesis